MTSLYASLEKQRPYILSVLRIVVALLFIEHGLQKYFGFPSAGPPMTTLLVTVLVTARAMMRDPTRKSCPTHSCQARRDIPRRARSGGTFL